jgi:hypothetical protein
MQQEDVIEAVLTPSPAAGIEVTRAILAPVRTD